MGKQRKDDNKSSDFGYGQYYLDTRGGAEKEKEDAAARETGKALQEWQSIPADKRPKFEDFKKAKQEDKPIKRLWNNLNEDPNYTLPDFETFKSDMADENKRARLWNNLNEDENYTLPEYSQFSADMGFTVDADGYDIKPKKKSGGTTSGFVNSDGLTFGTYVDNGQKPKAQPTATDGSSQKPAKEEKGFWETVWDGVTDYLVSPASTDQGGVFNTAEANEDIQERKNAEKQAADKAKAEEAYITNIDAFTQNPVGAFENIYIKNNFPDKWQEIQNAKASGQWNVGADPREKEAMNAVFSGVSLPGMPGASAVAGAVTGAVADISAWWSGEKNSSDDARMYLDANNWVAQQQSGALKKLEGTQAVKTYKTLQSAVQNNPAYAQLQQIGATAEKLKTDPAVVQYNSFIQNKGQELNKQDYATYQQMMKNPSVAAYIKAGNDYNAVLESEAGKQLKATMDQASSLYDNSKEVQLYQKIGDATGVTTKALQDYAAKFPKQYFAQVMKESNQIAKDSELRKLNPVIRNAVEITNTVLKVPLELAGSITSGAIDLTMSPIGPGGLALAIEEAFGDPANAQKVRAFTNSVGDGIVNLTTDIAEEAFPTTSRLTRPLFDKFVPYEVQGAGAFRVILDNEGNAIDAVDADGYLVPSETKSAVLENYRNDPNKPKEVNSFNGENLLPRMFKTGADLIALAYVPSAGAAFGLSQKGAMAMYGYLSSVHGAYSEIKASDPYITDADAMTYANFYGAVTAGAFTLTPQSLFGGKNVETGFQELKGDYMTILKGGVNSRKALQMSVGKQMGKQGLEMGAFGVVLNVVDFATKKTANAITGRESVEANISWQQTAETGLLMFVAGMVTAGYQGKGFKDKMQAEALYTGLKNYEATVEILKQQVQAGELSEQDFNRVFNAMTELKPIYDNLADLGKYNEAYKTGLIALYAEKLRVQEKLANIDAGKEKKSILSMGKTPERDLVAKQLEEIDNSIENLAIVNNPDFIVYTTAGQEVDREVQAVVEKINSMKEVYQQDGVFIGGLSEKAIIERLSPQEKAALSKAGKLVLTEQGFRLLNLEDAAYIATMGKMYVYDAKTERFMTVKETIGKPESSGPDYEILDQAALGVRVGTPRYKMGGETITRDQLQAKLKDPAFLADLVAGRVRLDVFNDLEMESILRKYTEPNLQSKGIREQAGEEGPVRTEPVEQPVEPTAETAQPELQEIEIGKDIIPQPITTENLPQGPTTAGELPPAPPKKLPAANDPTLQQLEGREIQSKNGNVGSVEQSDDGTWYVTFKDGTSKQLPVADKTNPTETISQLGYTLPATVIAAPKEAAPLLDVTAVTWTAPKVQMVSPEGYTFNIDGIGAVSWMKFNYNNNGGLRTADVITADGQKMKIRDLDIINDMATQLAYSRMTRLSMKPEVVSNEIAQSVEPLKQSLDIGMKSINSIVENAGDAAIIITRIQDGEIVTAAEQTAAFEFIVDAAARINKIDTKHETEKTNTLQWLNELYNQVANAEVELERPSESVAAQQAGEVGATTKNQPSTPRKQQYFEHPEVSSQTRAIIGRLVGKEGVESTIEAVRKAFEEGRNPAEVFGALKEVTRPYVEKVVAAMQPTVSDVAPAPTAEGRTVFALDRDMNITEKTIQGKISENFQKGYQLFETKAEAEEERDNIKGAAKKLAKAFEETKTEAPVEKVYTFDKEGNIIEGDKVGGNKFSTVISSGDTRINRSNTEVFKTKEEAEQSFKEAQERDRVYKENKLKEANKKIEKYQGIVESYYNQEDTSKEEPYVSAAGKLIEAKLNHPDYYNENSSIMTSGFGVSGFNPRSSGIGEVAQAAKDFFVANFLPTAKKKLSRKQQDLYDKIAELLKPEVGQRVIEATAKRLEGVDTSNVPIKMLYRGIPNEEFDSDADPQKPLFFSEDKKVAQGFIDGYQQQREEAIAEGYEIPEYSPIIKEVLLKANKIATYNGDVDEVVSDEEFLRRLNVDSNTKNEISNFINSRAPLTDKNGKKISVDIEAWERYNYRDNPEFFDILRKNGYDVFEIFEKGSKAYAVIDRGILKTKEMAISEAYHKALADGSNPKLVQAVAKLLEQPTEAEAVTKAEVATPEVPKSAEAAVEEVKGVITIEGLENALNNETADILSGGGAARRAAGEFVQDGVVYTRNSIIPGPLGDGEMVRFSSDVEVPFKYKLVEADDVQPSHINGYRNPKFFIPEAQPKNRNDQASKAAERSFAQNPRMNELGENTNAYSGAPIINSRGEVIQGNNRAAGLKIGYEEGNTLYKEQLAKQAEKFGFSYEQVMEMKNPILVRRVDVTDDFAIELGNYDAKDLETGGNRAIDPVATSRRMPVEAKQALTDLLFNSDYKTTSEAIKGLGFKVMDIVGPYINNAQRVSIVTDGRISANGANQLEALVKQFMFDNANENLPDMFERLPHTAKQGITKALPYIFNVPAKDSLLPDLQNAMIAVNGFLTSGISDIALWKVTPDMFNNSLTPTDIFSPLELNLAELLVNSKTQKGIADVFNAYAEAVKGKPGDMFEAEKQPLTKTEAVKQTFNIDYNETGPQIKGTTGDEGISGEENTPQFNSPDAYGEGLGGQVTPSKTSAESIVEAISRQVGIENNPLDFELQKEYPTSSGYPEHTIAHLAVTLGVDSQGIIRSGKTKAEIERVLSKAYDVTVEPVDGDPANGYKMLIDGAFYFNPFEKQNKALENAELNNNEVPYKQVLDQRTAMFQQQQFNFDKNDNVQQAKSDVGNVKFVSSIDVMLQYGGRTKIEKEYQAILKEYRSRNIPNSKANRLAELREMIGNERAAELAQDVVRKITQAQAGELKPGEYALRARSISISKDNFAVGKSKITSPADVAYLAKSLEDLSVEHFMVYVVDQNGQGHLVHIASGAERSVIAAHSSVINALSAFNAKGFYLIHNHPDGTTQASPQDFDRTREFGDIAKTQGVDMYGHVIVDHDKGTYGFISSEVAQTIIDAKRQTDVEEEVDYPVYMLGTNWDITNPPSTATGMGKMSDSYAEAARLAAMSKSGFAPKGGAIISQGGKVLAHVILDGNNDIQRIQRLGAQVGGGKVTTYGTFGDTPFPLNSDFYPGLRMQDHVWYESSNLISYQKRFNITYAPTKSVSFNSVTSPFGDKPTALQKAVEKTMNEGNLPFDFVMLDLFENYFKGDVIKTRKALQDIKDAYDEMSFSNEDWLDEVSSIDEVASFNLDNFLKSIRKPEIREQSLRQKYNDFASWFEWKYPGAKFYYTLDFDPQTGQVGFKIGDEFVKKEDGTPLLYSDWSNNRTVQKEWTEVGSKQVFTRPPLVTLDQDIIPTPVEHVASNQYNIDEGQKFAVNLILTRFLGDGEPMQTVSAFRTTGTGLGKLNIAHRGTGTYYALDAPFKSLGAEEQQVSKVEIHISPYNTLDLTTSYGQQVFAEIQKEAKARIDATPQFYRKPNMANDLIRDIALERGIEGVIGYIEPGAPKEERDRIGKEYVSYAGKELEPKGQKGFVLGDGMGIGKTRIAITTAVEMSRAKGLPALIITKGDLIVEQFRSEAAAMSIKDIAFKDNKGKIEESKTGVTVGTYEDMKNGKLGNLDKYGVIIFDEAHQMKNVRSARARVADDLMGQAEHVVFATGTPMDKPGQIVYFIKHMSNVPVDVQLNRMGLVYKNGRLYGKGNVKVKEAIIKWRNTAIEEGAYLRREYPFFGTVESVYIPMDQDVIDTLNEIKEKTGGRNAIMDANRYQEHAKVPYVLNETMKAIADGKQVVVFCVGVNPTEIKIGRKDFKVSLGYVPQFAGLFAEKLKAAGIPFSEIYGDDIPRKMEESRKFQRGETRVAIATIASGGTGIDLDDQVGDAPREVIFATLPWSADNYDQAVYRTSRRNTKTPSRTRFLFGTDSWADAHKERLLKEKNETLRNIQAGMDPDEAKMIHWRTDVEGGFIDIAEDEYDEDGNDISSVSKGEVMSVPTESKEKVEPATPEELFEAVKNGDEDAMREVGMAPAVIPMEQYIEVTEDTKAEDLPLFPETPQQVASEGQVPVTPPTPPVTPPTPSKPSGPTTSAMPSTPTTSPVSPAKKSSATDLGTATITPESEIPKIPYRTSNAKYKLQDIWNRVMNGKQRLDLATAVIRELQLMGVPTTGEYHLNVKNALGWYSHLQKDVKLKFSQDMFVAIHEGTHWVDFSAGGNITNKIILNGSRTLKEELGKIYELYYPGARPGADEELQIKEGLTMFMQIRLYNGSSPRDFPTVFADVFTKGGQFYHPKMDELFARFARLKNEVMTAPAGKKIGMRLASGEKLENQHTISTWNTYQKYLHNMYDESTALRLWDKMSGVSLGTAMERLAGQEDLQPGSKITGAQQWYFMWRNRMDLAANAISQTKDIAANIVTGGDIRPMFYDIDGNWKPAQYRMSDLFKELKDVAKNGALVKIGMGDVFVKDIASHFNEVNDIMHAFDSFLVARRIHSFFEEMNDIELGIKQIIANGASDYRILNAITDPDMYAVALANFKKNHVRPLEIEYAKWKKLNSIIANEGSSHKTENKLFVPSVMAWSSPLYANPVASWNPAAGDLVSFDNVSEVVQKYSGAFAKASGIYDVINHQYGIVQSVAFGLVNPVTANKWLARNAKYGGYASFQRHVTSTILSDEGSVSGGPVVGADQLSFTYAMGGSERTIFSPLKAQAAMIYEVFRKGNENKMWMALASQAQNNTELSRSFAKLRTTYVPEERNGERVLKPVIPGKMNVQGANIVTFKYNGRTQNYAILGEEMVALYMAMKNHPVVDSSIDNVIMQVAKLPATLFQMGTTGIYMQFALQNLPLDQASMGVNTYNKVIPIYTSIRNGLPALVSNAANLAVKTANAIGLYQKIYPGRTPTSAEIGYLNEYISMVGSNQSLYGELRSQNIREGLNRLADYENQRTAKGLIRGGKKLVETSLSIAAAPTIASEYASRAMGEYMNSRKLGRSVQASLMYAMEIAPFQKRGAARFAYRYMPLVPYMRPGQAMFIKAVEETKNRPARNAAVIAASIAMGAYLLASMYDSMTQDQKDDLAQKDGNELAKYAYIPSQNVPAFLRNDPDVVGDTAMADKNGFYKIRIPEQIGAWYALGVMAAFAQKDSMYQFEKSRAVRAVTTPVPTWQNPYEWLYGDADGITSSMFRNMYQNAPQFAKLFAGPAVDYQVTQAGHAPVYPRQVENFNPEHLYKVGRNGTSALAMELSRQAGYKVDPITIDYMGANLLGREYYFLTDIMMGKEGRNMFIEDRDRYNVRGAWYDNFYRKAQEYEGYFKVTNTIRLPHVEPSDPNYEAFDARLQDIAHKNAMFHQFKGLLSETRNMMDYAYANGKVVDQKAFDAMADVVKSIYYNKDNELVMQKMDIAYDAVKQAADDVGYGNLQYFKYPSLSIRVTTQEITGYYNKLLDVANMGN